MKGDCTISQCGGGKEGKEGKGGKRESLFILISTRRGRARWSAKTLQGRKMLMLEKEKEGVSRSEQGGCTCASASMGEGKRKLLFS